MRCRLCGGRVVLHGLYVPGCGLAAPPSAHSERGGQEGPSGGGRLTAAASQGPLSALSAPPPPPAILRGGAAPRSRRVPAPARPLPSGGEAEGSRRCQARRDAGRAADPAGPRLGGAALRGAALGARLAVPGAGRP